MARRHPQGACTAGAHRSLALEALEAASYLLLSHMHPSYVQTAKPKTHTYRELPPKRQNRSGTKPEGGKGPSVKNTIRGTMTNSILNQSGGGGQRSWRPQPPSLLGAVVGPSVFELSRTEVRKGLQTETTPKGSEQTVSTQRSQTR